MNLVHATALGAKTKASKGMLACMYACLTLLGRAAKVHARVLVVTCMYSDISYLPYPSCIV